MPAGTGKLPLKIQEYPAPDKKMVDAFVDKIEVLSAGKVTVHLVYDDMLHELVAYTKEREAAGNGQ